MFTHMKCGENITIYADHVSDLRSINFYTLHLFEEGEKDAFQLAQKTLSIGTSRSIINNNSITHTYTDRTGKTTECSAGIVHVENMYLKGGFTKTTM